MLSAWKLWHCCYRSGLNHPGYTLNFNKVNVTYSILAYNNSVLIVSPDRYSLDNSVEGSCTEFLQNRTNIVYIYFNGA